MVLSPDHEMSPWSKLKHSGKNMDVVLIKEMLQLGSIVSLSLCVPCACCTWSREGGGKRKNSKAECLLCDLNDSGNLSLRDSIKQELLSISQDPSTDNWAVSDKPGLANIEDRFANKKSGQTWSGSSLMTGQKVASQNWEHHIKILCVFLNSGGGVCQ